MHLGYRGASCLPEAQGSTLRRQSSIANALKTLTGTQEPVQPDPEGSTGYHIRLEQISPVPLWPLIHSGHGPQATRYIAWTKATKPTGLHGGHRHSASTNTPLHTGKTLSAAFQWDLMPALRILTQSVPSKLSAFSWTPINNGQGVSLGSSRCHCSALQMRRLAT